jgi:hypothetical protein
MPYSKNRPKRYTNHREYLKCHGCGSLCSDEYSLQIHQRFCSECFRNIINSDIKDDAEVPD